MPAGNKRLAPFLCRRRNTEKRRQASAVSSNTAKTKRNGQNQNNSALRYTF